MKRPFLIIFPLWALSLGAVFFIGKSASSSQQDNATGDAALRSDRSRIGSNASAAASRGQSSSATGARAASERLSASGLVRSGADSSEAIKDITRYSDPIARNNALLALIETLGRDEFEGVVASFRELGITSERRGEYSMLLTAWAQIDPEAAITYATENTGGRLATSTILTTWAASNPDAAISWAEARHGDSEDANPWLVGIIRGMAPNDLARATDLMETLPRSRERGRALDSMVAMMVSRDLESAKQWSETIDDEYLRAGARATTAEALIRQDAGEAARWLAQLGDVDALNRVGENISGTLYDTNPEEALSWVSTLPSAAMSEGAEGIVNRVVRENPVQAAEYISQLAQQNPDANFESSVRELVRGSTRSDPELAAVWVSGMSNEREKNRFYHRILAEWQGQNSAEASAWVQDNVDTLPRSVAQRFLRSPDRAQQ